MSSVNLVVSPIRLIGDQREARTHLNGPSFKERFFDRASYTAHRRPTEGRFRFLPVFTPAAIALLPFALWMERLAPVPIGVLHDERLRSANELTATDN